MKKYIKPELFYENFELSQSIATCDLKINGGTIQTCSIYEENIPYTDITGGFVNTSICTKEVEEYCYHPSNNGLPIVSNS